MCSYINKLHVNTIKSFKKSFDSHAQSPGRNSEYKHYSSTLREASCGGLGICFESPLDTEGGLEHGRNNASLFPLEEVVDVYMDKWKETDG